MFEIVKNPAITTSTITGAIDLMASLFDPSSYTEEVKTGKYKGHVKIVSKVEKQLPVWNQIKSWEELSRMADAIDQGFR
jgi:hypothetical protein